MTFTFKSETIGTNYIELSQDKFETSYKVVYGDIIGGMVYHEKTNRYGTMKKADAFYKSKIRQWKKEIERK